MVAFLPLAVVTVMVTAPLFTPFTTPLASTVAMLVSFLISLVFVAIHRRSVKEIFPLFGIKTSIECPMERRAELVARLNELAA